LQLQSINGAAQNQFSIKDRFLYFSAIWFRYKSDSKRGKEIKSAQTTSEKRKGRRSDKEMGERRNGGKIRWSESKMEKVNVVERRMEKAKTAMEKTKQTLAGEGEESQCVDFLLSHLGHNTINRKPFLISQFCLASLFSHAIVCSIFFVLLFARINEFAMAKNFCAQLRWISGKIPGRSAINHP
jgi:hypothetical protein